MAKKVLVIGAGISGLSAACYLAREGFDVTVLEKNESTGGRASVFLENGFLFDRGPSWYWMPDVFESFFSDFGKKVSDFYHLKRLDPSYRVVFENDVLDIPAGLEALKRLFERMEPGAGKRLEIFMKQAEYKYQLGINKLVYKPGKSIWEFLDLDILKGVLRMDVLTGMRSHVRKFFYDSRLVRLMEFPVIFLGGHAGQIPALYSLMNYADTVLGTWYPLGGMGKIPEALVSLATSMEVKILTSREVKQIYVQNKKIKKLKTADSEWEADAIVGSADYFHLDHLLPAGYRAYSETYKNSCVMAPSCLLFYVGVNRKIPGLLHHTLFFDEDFESHINSIYESPEWPQRPLFYLSAPSVTDPFVAPSGKENLFLLIPVASGLNDISDEKKTMLSGFHDR